MSNSVSDRSLYHKLGAVFIALSFISTAFYFLQNNGHFSGGQIALPKLIWLAYAILFWFILPAFIIKDRRVPVAWTKIYLAYLVNMMLRAAAELYMMYVGGNWSPYYGIAHDAFSVVLLLSLLRLYRRVLARDIFYLYACALVLMMTLEIVFVFYLMSNVIKNDEAVFFVPGDQRHVAVLSVTWLSIALLTVLLAVFCRRWVNGEFAFTNRRA